MRTREWAGLLLVAALPFPASAGADDPAAIFEVVTRQVVLDRVVEMEGGTLPAGRTLLVQTDLVPITPGYPTSIPPPPGAGDPAVLEPWASDLPLRFVPGAEIREAFDKGGWDAIHEKWPSALCTVHFSAVRFESLPERRAVVEVAVVWGVVAAEGYLVDLRWRAGGWKVVAVLPGWIS